MPSLVQSFCVQREINSVYEAPEIFRRKATDQNPEIPLVLIPGHRSVFTRNGWWMTIPSGVSCLIQKFGRHSEIAKPGGSVTPPWYRIAYIVTQQSCYYNAPVKECPTSDNVRVGVDCVIVFNIRDAEHFVYNLGATKFNMFLSGAVEEAIRVLVRKQSHQTVRTLRGSRADSMLTLLNKKFDFAGVTFSSCTITAVDLPKALESSLERTTELRKAMDRTMRAHTYELGEIQRKLEMELEELNRKNEQIIVAEQGRKRHAELSHEKNMVKEDERDNTARIETEQACQVKRMEVKAQLERLKVQMQRSRVEIISRAEADAEARRVKADIAFEKSQLNAEAEKARYEGEGETIRLDAEAEAEASQHLTHKRTHELQMREKDVIMQLAKLCDYNILGDSGDKLVEAMMTGSLGERPLLDKVEELQPE